MSATKFHLSLNVRDVRATAEFLELLLDAKPAALHCDYAKFELDDPAIVLSLVPTDVPAGAGLNHIGFRLPNREALSQLQHRIAAAGVAHECEESVACCHSRQTKFWTHDPAGNLWELYVLDEPQADVATPITISAQLNHASDRKTAATWSHRLGEPLPARIPAADGSLDEVVLEGTLNAQLSSATRATVLREVARTLCKHGKLIFRGLTADRELEHPPHLPGPAAQVEFVPVLDDVLAAIKAAGFVALELLTFGETYSFTHAGAEIRETRILARRAVFGTTSSEYIVIYRGPFLELRDDSGVVLRRGERACVDEPTWRRLQESNTAKQFLFFQGKSPPPLASI